MLHGSTITRRAALTGLAAAFLFPVRRSAAQSSLPADFPQP